MGLRHYGVVCTDDDEDSEKDNNDKFLPSTSRSAKKKRFSKQSDTKTDTVFTQSLSYGLNTNPANSSKYRRLEKTAVEAKEKRYNKNLKRGCRDNDLGEEERGLKNFSGSFSRQNKDEKKICRRSAQSSQNVKKKMRCKETSIGHKSDLKVGSRHYEEAAEADFVGNQQVKKQLEEEFEPSVLEDSYMTAKDNHIKAADIAERFQLLEEFIGPMAPKGQQSREADWIYDRAFGHLARPMHEEFKCIAEISKSDVVQEIEFLLTQLHDNKLEIPFIGIYRKEGCIRLLHKHEKRTLSLLDKAENDELNRYEALWQVFFWDKKWHLLQRRKCTLQEEYQKRVSSQSCKNMRMRDLLDRLLSTLQEAESEHVVNDVDAKFNLYFPHEEVKVCEGQYKRPRRQSYYSICFNSGLGDFAKHFGLSPEQLGENLQAMHKIHEVRDPSSAPEDIAMRYCTGRLGDPHSTLKGGRHMVASEISSEPAVREYARKIFSEQAVVNTRPTQKGNISIDKFHEYWLVKRVRAKPVSRFDNGEWLLIQRAEEEDLLEVTVKLTEETIDEVLMNGLQAQYLSVDSSRTAELWNEHRKEILKDAVWKMLLPSLEKETRMLLTARAKAWVQWEYANELWKRVSVSPYPHSSLESDRKADPALRVLACCWGPRNSATFVMLDSYGDIISTLQTGYLNLYGGSSEQIQRKINDQQRLQKFLGEHQPNVVVLGAKNLACQRLKDAILETISKLGSEDSCSLINGLDGITVVYGDESLSSLFEKSTASTEQPDIVRRAIALGRYLQNPLAMVASLCTPSREIVALKLHSMQSFLSTDEVYDAVEQVMITVTNQVGVDVNLAASHEWLFAPLQFVSGLGPRKASSLQHSIQLAGWIFSRKELMSRPISMKQNVFLNSSGFLRIRRVECTVFRHKEMNPFDDTRIHPEAYDLARSLAVHIYCADQGKKQSGIDEVLVEKAIHHIRENPDLLTDLTIMDFIQSIQGTSGEETLKDIQRELLHGFRDCRAPYVQPTQDEEFTWLTGEDEDSLAKGRIVNATARKIYQNRVMCVLESGIWGILQREEMEVEDGIDLSQVIFEGTILTCRVAHIQKEKFLVELTCRENNLENCQGIDSQDEPTSQNVSPSDAGQDKARTEDARESYFRPRMIVHPLFQNISRADAVKALLDKKLGDIIFHPSRKGPSCLSMTLKFYDDVYAHKDILEDEKETKDLASFLQLGKALKLGGKTLRNLQEVVTCYVDPLIKNLKEIIGFEMFRCGSETEIKALLLQDINLHSNSFVYCFSICHQYPGAITISYLRDMVVYHEYVDLHPEGYRFQHKIFNNVNTLVNYFKSTVMAPVNSGSGGSLGSGKSKLRGSRDNSQDHRNSRTRFDGGFKRGIRRDGGAKMWDKEKEEKGGQNQFLGRDNWLAKQGQQWGTIEDQSFNGDPTKSQPESGWSLENHAVGEGQAGKDSGWDCPTEMAATNGWESSNGKNVINEPGNLWGNATDESANGGGEFSKLRGSCSKSQDHWNSGIRSDGGFKWGIRQDGGTKMYDKSEQEKGGQKQFFKRDNQFANQGQQWGTFKDESLNGDPMKSQSESGWSPENGDAEGQAAKDSGWDCPTEMAVTNGWDSSNGKHKINEPGTLWGNATDEPANGGGKFSKLHGSCSKSQDDWNSRTRFEGGFNQGIRRDGGAKMCDKSKEEKGGQNDFFGRDNRSAKQGQQWGTVEDQTFNDPMKPQPGSGWSPENGAVGEDSGWDCPTEMAARNGWESSNGKHIINEPGNLWGNATDEPANGGGELSKLRGSCSKSQDHWNSGTRFDGGFKRGIRRDGGTNMYDKSKQGKGGQNQIFGRDNHFAKQGQQWGTFKDESLNGDPMKSQPESGWSPENGAAEGQAAKNSGWDCPTQTTARNGWEPSNGKDIIDDWDRPVRDNDSRYSRRDKGWGCGWDTMKLQGERRLPLEDDGAGSRRRGQAWDTVKDESLGRDARKLQSETGRPLENDVFELQKTENDGWDILPQMAAVDDWGCSKNKSAVCESVSTWKNATDKHASSRLSLGSELSSPPAKWQDSWNSDTKVGKGFYASRSDPGAFSSDQSQEKDGQYQSIGRHGGFRMRDQGRSMHKGETRSDDPMRSQLEHDWSHVNHGNGPSRRGQGWSTQKETNFDGGTVEFQPDSGWGSRNNDGTEVHVAKDSGWDRPPDTTEVNGWDLISKKKVVNDFASRWSNATNGTEVQTAKSGGWDSPSEMAGINRFSIKEVNNVNETGNPWINITELQTKDIVSESPSQTALNGRNLSEEKSVINGSGSPSSNLPNGSELQAAMAPTSECNSTKEKNVDNDLGSNATETQAKTSEWDSLSEMGTVNGEDLRKENNVNEFGSSISNAINDTEVQVADITGWDYPSEMVANERDLANKKNVVNEFEDTWSKATHEPNKNEW